MYAELTMGFSNCLNGNNFFSCFSHTLFQILFQNILQIIIFFTILGISLFVYGKLADKFSLDLDAGNLLIFFI